MSGNYSLSSHSVYCKCRSSRYFGQIKKSFDHPTNREFQLRDISIYMIDKTCLLYRLQHFFKRILRRRSFDNLLLIASDYLIDSSIATYCSQPFEFVKNNLCDKSSFMSFFEVSFLPCNLAVIRKIK